MPSWSPRSRSYLFYTTLGYVAAMAFLVTIIVQAHRSSVAVAKITYERAKARQTILHASELLSSVKDAETGQRGFILTHDLSYLEPYLAATQAIPLELNALVKITDDGPVNRELVDAIAPLISARLSVIDSTIRLTKAGDTAAAVRLINLHQGRDAMSQLRIATAKLIDAEKGHLKNASLNADEKIADHENFVTFAGLIALALLIFTTWASIRHASRRKSAELSLVNSNQALRESQVFLQQVFNSSRDCIKVVDLDCRLKFMNWGGIRLLEVCDFNAMKGADWLGFWQGGDLEAARAAVAAARRGEVGQFVASFHTQQTHTLKWFDIVVSPISGADGQPTELLITSRDVTEQKLNADRAFASHQKLSTFIDCTPVILWATDEKGIVTFSEGRGLAALGLKPGETVGWNLLERADANPESIAHAKRALAGETFRAISGADKMWIETYYSPILDADKKVKGLVAVSTDITEARNMRLELERSEERQRTALTAARIGHWDWDIAANQARYVGGLTDLYGRSPSSPLATYDDFVAIIHPDDRALVAQGLRRCVHEHMPYDVQFRIHWADGSLHWLHGKGNVVLDETGEPCRLTGVNIDITDQKILEIALHESDTRRSQAVISEKAAVEASEMKSRFLANMSHEIRTPINGVMGMISIMLDTALTPEQKSYGDTIRASGETLLTLVNDILDLSKAEAGKVELEIVDFELDQVITNVTRTLDLAAKKKGLKLRKTVSTDLPSFCKGDPTRLGQVIVNLVNNAIKFTGEGQVTIEVDLQQKLGSAYQVRFEVRDTGIGIAPEAIQKMFQSFSQADASTTRKYGGTGLGLAISKHLVSLMGGEIGVHSQPGQGSTFWFTVPLAAGAPVTKAGDLIGLASAPMRRLRILVAEDNSVNQLIALKTFEKMGHSAVAVANGQEAIDAVSSAPYDVVFMDCQMPELDGYGATRAIRAHALEKIRRIPIIAMTANAMTGDREKCLDAGMNDYVSKPMKQSDLVQAIQRIFSSAAEIEAKAA